MSSASFRPQAVSSALVLAFDEVLLGDISMAFQHVQGAANIVHAAGGPQALGLSGFLRSVLFSCTHGDRLLDWKRVFDLNPNFMKPE
ncbi:hypothetical protein FSARC_14858 [Fusarium sarcochroum]|uniref:Uncharacterized protein n=1 Tax=Fusarium sarcochroum TaxID=1208366 RepID=A0A8H4SQ91_9HYPO|nr:hypothetical protein FSARC_14858 [Fusarium sarcochroum]